MRVSKICTQEQIAFERQRECLRDWRWARRRSMIGVGGRWLVVIAIAVGIDFQSVVDTLERLFAFL